MLPRRVGGCARSNGQAGSGRCDCRLGIALDAQGILWYKSIGAAMSKRSLSNLGCWVWRGEDDGLPGSIAHSSPRA